MQAIGYTSVGSCLNKNTGKKLILIYRFAWWREFVSNETFWNSKMQVTNYPYHIRLLLLLKSASWVPGGAEDQLQNSWPCSGGNTGEGNGSLSWDELGAWVQDQGCKLPCPFRSTVMVPEQCGMSGAPDPGWECSGARDAGRQQAGNILLMDTLYVSTSYLSWFLQHELHLFKAEV